MSAAGIVGSNMIDVKVVPERSGGRTSLSTRDDVRISNCIGQVAFAQLNAISGKGQGGRVAGDGNEAGGTESFNG